MKNVLHLVINRYNCYNIYYSYTSSVTPLSYNHYPYYIITENELLMLNAELDTLCIIKDKAIIEEFKNSHIRSCEESSVLTSRTLDISEAIASLADNNVLDNIYGISYYPCISAFIPYEMYENLITEDFPNREELFKIIKQRLSQINNTNTKLAFFNKNGIDKFVEEGYILPFKHPCLKACTYEQRIAVLQNIYDCIDKGLLEFRAFDYNKISISQNFEITDIQDMYRFVTVIYYENYLHFINVQEPITSHFLIQFFNDALDTDYIMSLEATKKLFADAIATINKKIAEKREE